MKAPKVSVIIPAYNAEKYLEACLESVLGQTLKDIEIILVNDASPDNSGAICEKYAKNDARVKYIISEKNYGMSNARNKGLEVAKGEFLSFVDSDDWIDLDFLEKLYNATKQNEADIAVATMIRKRAHSQKFRAHYTKQDVFTTSQEKIDACNVPKACYVTNKLYKRSTFETLHFDEGVFYEDIRLTIKLVHNAKKLVTVPDTNYYYRASANSVVKTLPSKKKLKDYYDAYSELINFADTHSIKIPEKIRNITKDKKYFWNTGLLWLKIKKYYATETYYLFGFIPILSITKYGGAPCQKLV